MTDKKKIVLIYSTVAVISVLVLGMAFLLANLKRETRRDESIAKNVGKEVVEELMVLEEDFEMTRQDGSPVKISDLNDKVWLAVQFYAACPMCAERNAAHLVEIYKEYRDRENFVVACFSVDPAEDTEQKLSEVRNILDADASNWWFLKADQQKLWDYMEKEMGFTTIKERFEPVAIATKGRWAHDLGIQVYRGDTLVMKWHEGLPLDSLRSELDEALFELKYPADQTESN